MFTPKFNVIDSDAAMNEIATTLQTHGWEIVKNDPGEVKVRVKTFYNDAGTAADTYMNLIIENLPSGFRISTCKEMTFATETEQTPIANRPVIGAALGEPFSLIGILGNSSRAVVLFKDKNENTAGFFICACNVTLLDRPALTDPHLSRLNNHTHVIADIADVNGTARILYGGTPSLEVYHKEVSLYPILTNQNNEQNPLNNRYWVSTSLVSTDAPNDSMFGVLDGINLDNSNVFFNMDTATDQDARVYRIFKVNNVQTRVLAKENP